MKSSIGRFVIRLGRVLAASIATLGLAVALIEATQLGTAAAASFTWSGVTGVPVTPPANRGGEPKAHFDWGACPTAASCIGVGSYIDESGDEEAMAATRASGSWEPASEIALPANAASDPEAGFGLQPVVACTGPGACVAVGRYTTEGGDTEAMAVTEAGGAWGTAGEIEPPANAASNPETQLDSIACPASGSCVAGGDYTNEHGAREAMVAEETNGSWGPASEIEPPADAEGNPAASIRSVACPAAEACVAFGVYRDGSTDSEEAMATTEVGGTWGQATQVMLPAGASNKPASSLNSVVCVPSGPCVAVGHYIEEGVGREAMTVTETGGSWGQANRIMPPANAASEPEVDFSSITDAGSIACPASGSCVIAGEYRDDSGEMEMMVAEQAGGLWGQASQVTPPANAAIGNPGASAARVACSGVGSCVVIGSYINEGGTEEGMAAEQVGALWSRATGIPAPANAASNSGVIFGPIYCPLSWSCVAFGQYTESAGKTADMEVIGMTAPENTVAPTVSGTAAVGQPLTCSQGTWTNGPTAYAYRWLRDGVAIGGAESSAYTVATADEGHSIACEVTATNVVGGRSAAKSNSVAIREEARERREAEQAALEKSEEQAKVAAVGSVSLAASTIGVQGSGKGSIKLRCTGTSTCTGKLTLTARSKAKKGKKAKVETIGTAPFSIPAGKTATVTLTLTVAGRDLLKADHGKLDANLTMLKTSPSPANTQHKNVELVEKTATRAKKPK
jgi:hypothetical protein